MVNTGAEGGLLKVLECLLHISWHRKMHIPVLVVPIDGNSNNVISIPIFCNFVITHLSDVLHALSQHTWPQSHQLLGQIGLASTCVSTIHAPTCCGNTHAFSTCDLTPVQLFWYDNLYMPFWILRYLNPSSFILTFRPYLLMISSLMLLLSNQTYSGHFNRVFRYKLPAVRNLAPYVKMMLLRRIFTISMSAVVVPTS